MGPKRIAKRSKVKPFIKVVNYAHLLPTRYALELESLKGSVTAETFKEPTQREEAKKAIKKHLEERYARGANRWCTSDWVLPVGDPLADRVALPSYSLHQAQVLNDSTHCQSVYILSLMAYGGAFSI